MARRSLIIVKPVFIGDSRLILIVFVTKKKESRVVEVFSEKKTGSQASYMSGQGSDSGDTDEFAMLLQRHTLWNQVDLMQC